MTNNDKEKLGFWVRPDSTIGGIQYDKLVLQNIGDFKNISWETEDKPNSYKELHTPSYILNFINDKNEWSLYEVDNYTNDRKYYYHKDTHSILQKIEKENYSVMLSRFHNVFDMFLNTYNANDVVWKVQLHRTFEKNCNQRTVVQTIWLDEFAELPDKTQIWKNNNGNILTRYFSIGNGMTSKWNATLPTFNVISEDIAAFRNVKQLSLSYNVVNSCDIEYIIADVVQRCDYEIMKMKERDWNLYSQYQLGNETILYDDSYPFFHDN